MKKLLKPALLLLLLAAAAACIRRPGHDGSALRCAVCTQGSFSGSALLPGYNRELLKHFAASEGRDAEIRLAKAAGPVLDSLRNGSLDIVALPHLDSIPADSTLIWMRADSCGIWVFNSADAYNSAEAAIWFKNYIEDPDYAVIRQPFFDIYNPMNRVSADFVCPYDSLIKAYADTIGWDWKLLAALIYQESKFRTEAESPAGARGLMQLLPSIADKYGCSDTFDPEDNIRAGVKLLGALEQRYKSIALNPDECRKYTLAAYNAGVGRVGDCISYARHCGADVSRWENVAKFIPDMQQDSIAAIKGIQHGTFNGRETIYFVRQVNAFHNRYRHICP